MRKLGTIDLEILHLAISKGGTFNENNLEDSKLKRLGVGKILDSLATLKDRKMLTLNSNGSFSITELAKEILWSKNVPEWARILRLLQIRSCGMGEITDILKISHENAATEIEMLRKNQMVLMSPQRHRDALIKIFEILPKGAEQIDRTEIEGFDCVKFGKHVQQESEILDTIKEIIQEIQDTQIEQTKKDAIVKKLSRLYDRLQI